MIKSEVGPSSIFVSYASGLLTDHEPHGDGLICFSLLDGLVRRGHKVFAYTPNSSIRDRHPRLQVQGEGHHCPADSLAPWEHNWRAGRWLREVLRTERIDLTWRMHPYGEGCPAVPPTAGRPLIIGPLFREWPAGTPVPPGQGRPRFGVGIGGVIRPLARRGWERSLDRADLVLCATPGHVREIKAIRPNARVVLCPVIIDPPSSGQPRTRWAGRGPFHLLFVANLAPGKNPGLFCEVVGNLRGRGLDVQGTMIGDGPERVAVEALLAARGLDEHVQLLGKIPNAQVFEHHRNSHLLVSTSLGEPYGRGIAEAMAVGTPAACHRSGGPAEIITPGDDGLLVDAIKPEAYTDAIASVIVEPTRWEALAAGAARTADGWRADVVLGSLEQELVRLRLRSQAAGRTGGVHA